MRIPTLPARTLVVAAAALALLPSLVEAQATTRRRQAPITIRGTVPTPQVVTVRPREVPSYARNVLVPNFYDRDFWAVILPGYLVVPERMVTGESPLAADGTTDAAAMGAAPMDAPLAAPADSAGAMRSLPPLPPRPSRPFTRTTGAPPSGGQSAPAQPAPPAGASTSGAPGTAPALPAR